MTKLVRCSVSVSMARCVKSSDLILVMKDGDIIEQGTHESLLAAGGFYADLYNSQFEQAS